MPRSTIRAATVGCGAASRTIATTRGTYGSIAAIATRATTTIVQTALASAASRTNTAKRRTARVWCFFYRGLPLCYLVC
ncbi:hypothetical protein, partial [Winogradskyella ouciana]|uniref:hypothetical protein n=1 Tax=Winogradskyella ouciana TaxID=2608631 RepID=UPI001F451A85